MSLSRLHRLMWTDISQLEKVEWLEYFAEARGDAVTSVNILSGWCGVGLLPQNQDRILGQIPDAPPKHQSNCLRWLELRSLPKVRALIL